MNNGVAPSLHAQRSARHFQKREGKQQYWASFHFVTALAGQPKPTFCDFWQHIIFIKSSEISSPNSFEKNQDSI